MSKITALFIAIILLNACKKQDEYILSKSIFIEDPYNPGLPIYSEWGYNTFGAYYDRIPFRSSDDLVPAKVYVNNDTLHFILQGIHQYNFMSLKFSIKGFSPQNEFELTTLNNVHINLKDSGRAVVLKKGSSSYNLTILEGEIHFKKAQKLFVDNELYKTILCGTFRLKTFMDNEPISIYNGRFDVGIGYENFFNY
ncbi:MAG: hypothetical protein N2449_07925 [Bacteroidales bacterium]|nr:hypothetical protein [Bacteroidales bacterium]